MAQSHFVAVGGTGQHAALSFVDIAVLGEWIAPVEPCRLWLFDADASAASGVKSAWDEACEQVKFLRRTSRSGDQTWRDPLNSHHRPYLETAGGALFKDTMCEKLGPILFDPDQRSVSYRNGYYGEASVAATVFGTLLETEDQSRAFHDLLQAPLRDDSRIVIAGSAVGGTGSGCMPRFVEALYERAGQGANGRLMALLYLPWFRLEGGETKAAKRMKEMAARTASGLFYYNTSLRQHSAAVVLGHPDIAAARKARPWQGDTQQSRHDDLTLPTYGACVASQFFSAERPSRFGLYGVASPARTDNLLGGTVPVGVHTDSTARWTLERLVQANDELCKRLYWVARYIETVAASRPATLGRGLEVPGLLGLDRNIAAKLDAWIQHKAESINRVKASLQADSTSDEETSLARPAYTRPPMGLKSLKSWVPAKPVRGAEQLAAAVADQMLTESRWSGDVALAGSTERLLPPRTSEGPVKVQPRKVAIGTLAPMDELEARGLINHNQITARAIPAPIAREVVLRGLFDGTVAPDLDLEAVLTRGLRAGYSFGTGSTASDLLNRWFLVLLGFAAGRVRVVDEALELTSGRHAVKLATSSDTSVSGRFGKAPILQWDTESGKRHLVGYGASDTLFVPAAGSADLWNELLLDIRPGDRQGLAESVAAWVVMLERVAQATRTEPPSWLRRLRREWVQDAWLTRATFGLSRDALRTEWGDSQRVFRLPIGHGKADATWQEFFQQFGLDVVRNRPQQDQHAVKINELLRDPVRCPRYRHLFLDGTTEDRIALWLLKAGHPDSALHRRAAQLIQGRYYVSVDAKCVWDVRVDDHVVNVVDPVEILLHEVGFLVEDEAERLPDWPVRWEFLDLLDLPACDKSPKADGAQVSYDLRLRGYPDQYEHTAKRVDHLVLPVGVLMWPNFTAPGWLQRYIWVRNAERKALQCWIAASETPTSPISENRPVKLSTDPKPVAFTLPEDSHVPRALYLQDRDAAYGVFRLSLDELHRGGKDNWGIDFGTSGSVVAAVKAGHEWTQAKLLSPGPSSDATYKVLLGEPVRKQQCIWFPSWDGMAPRTDQSAVLPTRILVAKGKAGDSDPVLADESSYGNQWLLDYGGELDVHVKKTYSVISELKWGRQVSTRRQAYLLRLLEQAAAWRARTPLAGTPKDCLPKSVTAVFTLPLRMRDEAYAFESDVKAVIGRLKSLTGITVIPSFLWESNAGAVPENSRRKERVYATIDLGGGSLDFWGCYTGNDGRVYEHSDSLLLGGGSLIQALSQGGLRDEVDSILRKLGPEEPAGASLADIVGYSDKVSTFFEVVREVSARWLSALATGAIAKGSDIDEFNVGMLGRAWFMGGPDWRNTSRALGMVAVRMAELGCDVPLVAHADVPDGQVDRKTYLARYVAGFSGNARDSIRDIAADQHGFVGVDLVSEGESLLPGSGAVNWTDTLPIRCGEKAKLYLANGGDNHVAPPVPQRIAAMTRRHENTVLDRMNRKGGDQQGYRDPLGSQLIQSPFHSLMEMAVRGWADD